MAVMVVMASMGSSILLFIKLALISILWMIIMEKCGSTSSEKLASAIPRRTRKRPLLLDDAYPPPLSRRVSNASTTTRISASNAFPVYAAPSIHPFPALQESAEFKASEVPRTSSRLRTPRTGSASSSRSGSADTDKRRARRISNVSTSTDGKGGWRRERSRSSTGAKYTTV